MATPESRLAALGIDLGEPAAPVENFVPTVRSGQLPFVSGQICFSPFDAAVEVAATFEIAS